MLGYGSSLGHGQKDNGEYDTTQEIDYASATAFMANRKCILNLGVYDEWFVSHYEDVDLSLRARRRGGKCFRAGSSVMYHKGAVTYKKYAVKEITIYNIRKNRIRVIVKNYTGIVKLMRLSLVTATHIPLMIYDMISPARTNRLLTIQATWEGLT